MLESLEYLKLLDYNLIIISKNVISADNQQERFRFIGKSSETKTLILLRFIEVERYSPFSMAT